MNKFQAKGIAYGIASIWFLLLIPAAHSLGFTGGWTLIAFSIITLILSAFYLMTDVS